MAIGTVWSVDPKIFTSWLFTEKVCQPMGDISGLLHIQSSKIAYQFFSTSFQTNHQIFIEAYYIRIFSFGFKGWKKFSGSRLKLKMGGGRVEMVIVLYNCKAQGLRDSKHG